MYKLTKRSHMGTTKDIFFTNDSKMLDMLRDQGYISERCAFESTGNLALWQNQQHQKQLST